MPLRAAVFLPLLWLVASASEERFTVNYQAGEELSNTSVSYDRDENIIRTFTPAGEHFVQVDSLEDYNVGFSATRLPSQESCYISKLESTFSEQLAYYISHKDEPIIITDSKPLAAFPAIDDEEFGARLNDFCGNYPIYKLGTSDDEFDEGPWARRVFVKFYNCYPMGCKPYCYYTTITVPTGRTPSFTWFCG